MSDLSQSGASKFGPVFTDDEVYAAIVGQAPNNPTGCSAIDTLIGLGFYQAAGEALERLVTAGRLIRTTPGNYLPTTPATHIGLGS